MKLIVNPTRQQYFANQMLCFHADFPLFKPNITWDDNDSSDEAKVTIMATKAPSLTKGDAGTPIDPGLGPDSPGTGMDPQTAGKIIRITYCYKKSFSLPP